MLPRIVDYGVHCNVISETVRRHPDTNTITTGDSRHSPRQGHEPNEEAKPDVEGVDPVERGAILLAAPAAHGLNISPPTDP